MAVQPAGERHGPDVDALTVRASACTQGYAVAGVLTGLHTDGTLTVNPDGTDSFTFASPPDAPPAASRRTRSPTRRATATAAPPPRRSRSRSTGGRRPATTATRCCRCDGHRQRRAGSWPTTPIRTAMRSRRSSIRIRTQAAGTYGHADAECRWFLQLRGRQYRGYRCGRGRQPSGRRLHLLGARPRLQLGRDPDDDDRPAPVAAERHRRGGRGRHDHGRRERLRQRHRSGRRCADGHRQRAASPGPTARCRSRADGSYSYVADNHAALAAAAPGAQAGRRLHLYGERRPRRHRQPRRWPSRSTACR